MRSGRTGAKKRELIRLVRTAKESSADTVDTGDFRFDAQLRSRQAISVLIEVNQHRAG